MKKKLAGWPRGFWLCQAPSLVIIHSPNTGDHDKLFILQGMFWICSKLAQTDAMQELTFMAFARAY